jgi:thiosulfate dehydrogenase
MRRFFIQSSRKLYWDYSTLLFATCISAIVISSCTHTEEEKKDMAGQSPWYGWNKYQIKPEDSLVRLGHDLVENTAWYFGPKGKIAAISNGMNCQNCHINSGIVPWGNNFSAVIMSYPRFSYRSGKMMSVSRRINDCFERSLNGLAIDTNSREMQAIIAYIHWIGDDIPKNNKPVGSGIMQLSFLNRTADTLNGKKVYINTCQRCHGYHGQGQLNSNGIGYIYPPLWGESSYNAGAGLHRLSTFAGFVKNNMPFPEATFEHPTLTNEEAWDVAAFVNSQPRPPNKNKNDYPDVSKKPIDEPTGPYSDTFSEQQHKFGPFQLIKSSADVIKK